MAQNRVIQDFLTFIERTARWGVRFRRSENESQPIDHQECRYYPGDEIKEYFDDEHRIEQFLDSIYSPASENKHRIRLDSIYIGRNYPKVLSNLLLIGQQHWIQYFVEKGLDDNEFPRDTKPKDWPLFANLVEDFWPAFDEQQWAFYPHEFESCNFGGISSQRILPLVVEENIIKGSSGSKFKIKINTRYDSLRQEWPANNASQDQTYILKSYDDRNARSQQFCQSEVHAFNAMQCNMPDFAHDIVNYYGSFKQNDTCNIITEYAEHGDLEDFFRNRQPPYGAVQIRGFWKAILALTEGLSRIHMVPAEDNSSGVFQGSHQDIKPANIFVFSSAPGADYPYMFKIGDLGLAHFDHSEYYQPDACTHGMSGTRTYGSPESERARQISPSKRMYYQRSDVWSLACVLSVAGTWITGGWDFVQEYSQSRSNARIQCHLEEIDSFHDNHVVLDMIPEWHHMLKDSCRTNDTLTGRLWDDLLKDCFNEVNGRPTSELFSYKSKGFLKNRQLPTRSTTFSAANYNESQQIHQTMQHQRGLGADIEHWPSARFPHNLGQSRQQQPGLPLNSNDYSSWTPLNLPQLVGEAKVTGNPINSPSSSFSLPRTPPDASSSSRTNNDAFNNTRLSGDMSPLALGSVHPNDRDSDVFQTGSRVLASPSKKINSDSKYHPDSNANPGRHLDSPHVELTQLNQSSSWNKQLPNGYHSSDRLLNDHPQQHLQSLSLSHQLDDVKLQDGKQVETPETGDYYVCKIHGRYPAKLPWLSVEELKRWRVHKDSIRNKGYLEALKKRDHVFLIDDALSMLPHWENVVDLFSLLTKFIKKYDDDGLELYFTQSTDHLTEMDTTQLIEKVKSMKNSLDSNTEPANRLRQIIKDHHESLFRGKRKKLGFLKVGKKAKYPLSVYFFTNGKWRLHTDLKPVINGIVKQLEYSVEKDPNHVGIQIIQFGDDEMGSDRLDHLDKGLGLTRDIVDTEPSDCNIWKMLLGSIDPSFDKEECPLCEQAKQTTNGS